MPSPLEGSLVDWRGELLLDNTSCIHIYLKKAAIKKCRLHLKFQYVAMLWF